MKDGPEGDVIVSRLEAVEVGTDTDGEQINSCVVIPVDTPITVAEPTLSKNQTTMFSVLHSAGTAGLPTQEWNDRAREVGLGTKRRADLHDLREALKSMGRVRQYGDRWVVMWDWRPRSQ
jgi:hypothetical protein